MRVSRFLYLVGGWDSDLQAPSQTVFRAEVLDPLKTPEMSVELFVTESLTHFPLGTYYYRVSAVFASNDANNPGGESLPGEVLTIFLPDGLGTSLSVVLTLSWQQVPDAVGYRLYRFALDNRLFLPFHFHSHYV